MEKRECNYRRCNNDITEMRKDAKFCCRGCKDMERTYKKRRELFIEKYKGIAMLKVNSYKKLKEIVKNDKNEF